MSNSLENRINVYWKLSSIWNEKEEKGTFIPNAYEAIEICNQILEYSRPGSHIEKRTSELLNEIILYGNLAHKRKVLQRNKKKNNILRKNNA